MPYSYKIAALRTYGAISLCLTQDLPEEKIEIITAIAKRAHFNEKIIKKIYNLRIRKWIRIESA